ncbi:hypothetical protein V6N12_033277 [Hibiscus sabdariffa]|uniref:NADH:ubiquinone reductase (non-electrogenic) n=1 Tax=Hibiscus sabdariffa TaxID=183260 RepID=A0ABR2BAE2_9ROSI
MRLMRKEHGARLSKPITSFVQWWSLIAYAEANTYNGSQGHIAHADATASDGGHALSKVVPKKKKVVLLGTGWAGMSFLKSLNNPTYEKPAVLLSQFDIIRKKNVDISFSEAECVKIDPQNKKIYCRSTIESHSKGEEEFAVDYDYLIIAVGAQEIDDAKKIRKNVIESFEKACLPSLSDEERKKILHFVIVGGGPTGVEFAAELHDFVNDDVVKLYPKVKDLVKITLLEATDHILNMFDKRITNFAENKFGREGIDVKLGGNRRALATDEWLRVEGFDSIYALGDCATINQRKVTEDIAEIFKKADKDNSGTLTVKEFQETLNDICERYPQVELYLKNKQKRNIVDLVKEAKGDAAKESMELNIEEFKAALSEVDSQMKNLPATAQVANQQGAYLAKCFNRMEECEKNPEGPPRFRGTGRHRFHPFRYRHLGQFAPLGGEQTAAQLPGDWVSIGHSSQWLWYSVYASKQVSWRTRALVVSDWLRRFIFGRDTSGI